MTLRKQYRPIRSTSLLIMMIANAMKVYFDDGLGKKTRRVTTMLTTLGSVEFFAFVHPSLFYLEVMEGLMY